MAPSAQLANLACPLVSIAQLESLESYDQSCTVDGPKLRFAQTLLTQAAGVLLGLRQDVVAIAIVLLQRFWVRDHTQSYDIKTSSQASLYLSAKLSSTPLAPRSVCNVYAYLLSSYSPLPFVNIKPEAELPNLTSCYVSEGVYEKERERIYACESLLLSSIGFDTQVALPHCLALTYLQALGIASPSLAARALQHLNGGLLSPQLLYLTHQPNALASAAIYLAAKEVGVKLVDGNWWELFDVDREDLGFLVLAFGSFEGFAHTTKNDWDYHPLSMQHLMDGS